MDRVKLKDVCKLLNGRAYKQDELLNSGKYPVLRVGNFFSDKDFYYSDMELDEDKYCDNGDLLFAWSASFGPKIWNGERVIYHYHIWKMVLSERIDRDYLFYYLQFLSDRIKAEGHGGIMIHTTKSEMENREFLLPDIYHQKVVARKLARIVGIIEKRKKELVLLNNLIKARFVEMFGDPVTNPKGWNETSIGDECFYIKDGPHKSLADIGKGNGGHPFISVRNIVNHTIDFSTARYISDEDYKDAIKKCHPEKGDMLYSKGGTTGIAKLIDVDIEFANWVHVAVLKYHKDKLNGVFFENMLNSDYCYDQSQRLTKGIANRDLVLNAMAQIKMYRPPIELQNQFEVFVRQVDKSKFEVQRSLDETQKLFDSLMQLYFD